MKVLNVQTEDEVDNAYIVHFIRHWQVREKMAELPKEELLATVMKLRKGKAAG